MNDKKRKALVEQVAMGLCKTENRLSTRKLKLEMRNQYPTQMWNQYHDGKHNGVTEYFHQLVSEGKFVSIANNGTYQTYAASTLPIVSRKGDTFIPDAEVETLPAPKKGTLGKLVKALGKSKPSNAKAVTKLVTKKVTKPVAKKVANPNHNVKSISKSAAAALITQVTGRFGTVEFVKKDNTLRKMNFRYCKDQDASVLGYVKVIDIALYNTSKKALLAKGLTDAKAKVQAEKGSVRNINLQTLKSVSVNGVKNNVR